LKLNNKFAIGCLIQWYEIEMIGEYLQSVKNSLDNIENKKNVIIDLYFNCSQALEKIDGNQMTIDGIREKYREILDNIFGSLSWLNGYNINSFVDKEVDRLYTIADYRRDFNDKYCTEVDVLMWGESDSLIPRQTFQILDNLHSSVKEKTPKYVSFFSTCKMWDESWEVLEHPEFTVKPFIDMDTVDTENWWSLRYNMNIDEMNSFNDKVEELDIRVINQYKFNGCGLVISSDVVKSGVNIPKSSFFIHEDTAFMLQLQRLFGGEIPQYVIKNILLVHNRKHTKKRFYVEGEDGVTAGDVSGGRLRHDWYKKASDMSHHNTYNMFNQSKIYTWKDVFDG
tara:strand:- start:578 stop:1594 length:1017 start_codon:yes stop_codon:yes gene_type:complete